MTDVCLEPDQSVANYSCFTALCASWHQVLTRGKLVSIHMWSARYLRSGLSWVQLSSGDAYRWGRPQPALALPTSVSLPPLPQHLLPLMPVSLPEDQVSSRVMKQLMRHDCSRYPCPSQMSWGQGHHHCITLQASGLVHNRVFHDPNALIQK